VAALTKYGLLLSVPGALQTCAIDRCLRQQMPPGRTGECADGHAGRTASYPHPTQGCKAPGEWQRKHNVPSVAANPQRRHASPGHRSVKCRDEGRTILAAIKGRSRPNQRFADDAQSQQTTHKSRRSIRSPSRCLYESAAPACGAYRHRNRDGGTRILRSLARMKRI